LDIATTNTTLSPNAMTYFLDLKQQFWYMYEVESGVFEQIDSGPLIKGALPAAARVGATPTGSPNAKGKLDQMW
ncbi:MAG: hypothetical protein ABI056_04230, partial [Caulobacteraceae bacterium]